MNKGFRDEAGYDSYVKRGFRRRSSLSSHLFLVLSGRVSETTWEYRTHRRFWLESIAYYSMSILSSSYETDREERGDDQNVKR